MTRYRYMRQVKTYTEPKFSKRAAKPNYLKVIVSGLLLMGVIWMIYAANGGEDYTLHQVRRSADDLRAQVNGEYLPSVFLFIAGYVALTTWFPAAAVLTLLAGFLFGTWYGVLYVVTAAVLAAAITFGLSRYFLGNWVQRRWVEQLETFNDNLSRFGMEYLILVRLIPMMPFLLVNIFAGITKVSYKTFVWTTAVGILPGIILFSYMGRSLPEIASVEEIWSWKFVAISVLMALFLGASIAVRWVALKKKNCICLVKHNKGDGKRAYVA